MDQATSPRTPRSSRPDVDARIETRRLLDRLAAAGAHGIADAELADDQRAGAADLARHGLAVRLADRWYPPFAAPGRIARVDRLERGDAFLRPFSAPGTPAGRYYVARRRLRRAETGDIVLFEPLDPSESGPLPEGKAQGRPGRLPEAKVLRILAHGPSERIGLLRREPDSPPRFEPFDPNALAPREVVDADDIADATWVRLEIERPRGGDREPFGRVVEPLGPEGQPAAEIAVVLAHYQIPHEFPPEAIAEAAALPAALRAEDRRGREDWTARSAVTIDGPKTRDFDDAISAERRGDGGFQIAIHVADVAAWVPEGSALDLEAFRRATSVYYPGRTVPMLPESLSNGLGSLVPGEPRLALSAILDVARDGRIEAARFAETVIQSARRLTYGEVRRLLEEPAAGDAATYGTALQTVQVAREAMAALLAARLGRGSLDFDLPEGDVEIDEEGALVGIQPGERHVGHRIVEEFMIAANEAVATLLLDAARPTLFRAHDAPAGDRRGDLVRALAALGVPLAPPATEAGDTLPTSALREVLERAAGRPDEALISALVLRALPAARYSADNRGHAALAAPRYLHFTSPIRRYPDLVVHRSVKALLAGTPAPTGEREMERLAAIAEHATEAERRAERSERELLQWWKVRWFGGRIGERFTGRVTGVQPFGLFVVLDGFHVDGLVPVATLGEERFRFDAEALRLIGESSGRSVRLADPVQVELASVDLAHRGLDLRLLAIGRSAD